MTFMRWKIYFFFKKFNLENIEEITVVNDKCVSKRNVYGTSWEILSLEIEEVKT